MLENERLFWGHILLLVVALRRGIRGVHAPRERAYECGVAGMPVEVGVELGGEIRLNGAIQLVVCVLLGWFHLRI